MNPNVKLIIGADIVPVKSNTELFNRADSKALIGDALYDKLNEADFRIFNLETPLTDELSPIQKSGPVLQAPECTIEGIKALNPSLLVLSNNHILDHGSKGVENTIKILKSKNIPFMGIGKNSEERAKPYILEKNNIKIGIYNCCEHEFSIAKEGNWGANSYDPLESFDAIAELKKNCDYVVVLYHGGKEFFRYPSPNLIKVFRKFAEKGADVIIAQHTHCIGSYEDYAGSLLLYGQGNFLFDDDDKKYDKYLNTGLLVKLTCTKENMTYEYIPLIREKNHIRFANETEQKSILQSFYERSLNINNEEFIKAEYNKKASESLRGYLLNMHIGSKIDTIFLRIFLKLSKNFREKYFKKITAHLLNTKNYISCESHRELLEEGLQSLIKN